MSLENEHIPFNAQTRMNTIPQAAYREFLQQVKARQIAQVTIKVDRIEYSLKPEFGGQQYYTISDQFQPNLPNLLRAQGIPFIDERVSTGSVLGMLLSMGAMAGALVWLAKFSQAGGGIGGLTGIGKSKA
ncbi:hypothetical protein IQ250_27990, partial [Pseudanabaenaceae cyanobacterium LEGE 13415]|nr:hypothetical protein [Pseudanabaenaceae cyanobacterium LEGE 13415]